ncbi:MAG: FG-GAP-like repeat-containing protein [Solirubrobacteraceae bacterium]
MRLRGLATGVAALALAGSHGPSARADLQFFAPNSYAVHLDPAAIAVDDVNADGIPDVVTADSGSDGVSVLLGHADGTLAPARPFSLGSGSHPTSVAIGGFQGPGGQPDIFGNSPSGIVRLPNQGNGSFGAPKLYPTPWVPAAVSAPYLQDFPLRSLVAVGGGASGTLGVWEASCDQSGCDGSLSGPATAPAGSFPVAVAVDDFNGDGFGDLAILDQGTASVRVILNDTNDRFSVHPAAVFSVGNAPTGIVTGDFDSDGKPDIAVADSQDNTVSVLRDRTATNATMASFAPRLVDAVGSGPAAIAAGDLNGDGRIDLVTANQDGTLSVLLGNGDGTFAPERTLRLGPDPLTAVAIADLNGDGAPDIVATDASGAVKVLLAAPIPQIGPRALDFGAGDVSDPAAQRTVTITNQGTGSLRVGHFVVAGDHPADFTVVSDTCGVALALHASCRLGVRFTASAPGPRDAELDVFDNADSAPTTIALSGTGVSPTGPSLLFFRRQPARPRAGRRLDFSFAFSEPATARLIVARLTPGHRKGRRCLVSRRPSARRLRCTIARSITTEVLHASAGDVQIRLKAGVYSATLSATGLTGHRSRPTTLSFTVSNH